MVAVADTFAHAGINRLVVGARSRLGMRVLPAKRTGPEVLRALQRNDVVALLAKFVSLAELIEQHRTTLLMLERERMQLQTRLRLIGCRAPLEPGTDG